MELEGWLGPSDAKAAFGVVVSRCVQDGTRVSNFISAAVTASRLRLKDCCPSKPPQTQILGK